MPRKTKYRAVRTVVDGITFASKREAARYGVLRTLAQAGKISGLTLQPRFPLLVNGTKIGEYRADFRYVEGGKVIIEDCKGFRTRQYIQKRKHVEAQYGITIRET